MEKWLQAEAKMVRELDQFSLSLSLRLSSPLVFPNPDELVRLT